MAPKDDESSSNTELALPLPSLEEQQEENKRWQAVYDTPAAKMAESASLLEDLRAANSGYEHRIDVAQTLKAEANAKYGQEDYAFAMRSYVTCLWLLQLDDPPLPKLLTNPETPAGADLLRLLDMTAADGVQRSGSAAATASAPETAQTASSATTCSGSQEPLPSCNSLLEDAEQGSDGSYMLLPSTNYRGSGGSGVTDSKKKRKSSGGGNNDDDVDGGATSIKEMQIALQLNVAAVALKLEDWAAARKACELVLAGQPMHTKALYRLAQAHEGAGDLGAAMSLLSGQLLKHEPGHREGLRLLTTLKARGESERQMFGGLFERAQRPRSGDSSDAGLYSENALAEEARKRKEEKERLLKLENLAKLPTDMWADTFGSLEPEQLQKLNPESKELAAQMPDGGWAKAMANFTPEQLKEAKEAVELHKAREELKKQGLLTEGEGEEEDDADDDDMEAWFDWMITKAALPLALIIGFVGIVTAWTTAYNSSTTPM